jgi:hypothetical protein
VLTVAPSRSGRDRKKGRFRAREIDAKMYIR